MTKDDIIDRLNEMLNNLAWTGCLTDEDIEDWGQIMLDYHKIKEVNPA